MASVSCTRKRCRMAFTGRGEDAHQIVVQRQVEAAGAGVRPGGRSGPRKWLSITARLVAFAADDVQGRRI